MPSLDGSYLIISAASLSKTIYPLYDARRRHVLPIQLHCIDEPSSQV
jgi:hypothetical protein